MRTTIFTENGREHILCFSPWAQRAVLERYGELDNLQEKLSGGSTVEMLDEAVWILSILMEAGDKFAKIQGMENARTFTPDELLCVCDIEDFAAIKDTVQKAVVAGSGREVEVVSASKKKVTSKK